MNSGICKITGQESLAEIIQGCTLELDADKVSDRIAETKTALVTRARELFHSPGDNIKEEHAVGAAMYASHPLRTALKCNA